MARKKKQRSSCQNKKTSTPSPAAKTDKDKLLAAFKNWGTSIEKIVSFFSKYSRWAEVVALILVITVGVLFRLEDLGQWRKNEQRAFFNKQPLHTTFDAFFYLSLALDIVEGTYNPIAEKRSVPDCPPRPSPPPLISVMAAGVAKATSFSMSWIGAILPPILGPLLAIPLYFVGRFYGGPLTGIIAALMVLLYPFYVYRSNIGRFDTDCMNVTWVISAAYFFLRFGIEETKKRYLYLLSGIVVYGLFLWWWDQTPTVVTAITFPPLVVALLFFYRPNKKEGTIFYGILGFAAVISLLAMGLDMPLKIVKTIWSQYLYISKETAGDFPNIGITISEQSKPSLEMIVNYTTKNTLAFTFALGGIVLLFWKRFKDGLFLVSFIVLSLMTVLFANRFLIFMLPLLALGTGYALTMLWNLRRRFSPLYIICPLLLALMVWPLYKANKAYTQWPKEPGSTAAGMDVLLKKTPSDSVIWAWWDHGHALTYLARRAAMNDGIVHGGERTVYNAIPLTTDDFRLSANFMHFFVIRGMKGIRQFYKAVDNNRAIGLELTKDILRAGPQKGRAIIKKADLKSVGEWQNDEQWLQFFFPHDKRPVYLFLDNLLPSIAYWWYWFGTWDVAKKDGQHPTYKSFYNIRNQNGNLTGSNGLRLNTESGKLYMSNRVVTLSHLASRKQNAFNKKSYNNKNGYRFEYVERARFGALMDAGIAESVFNKLFIRHLFPKKYFRPLHLQTPFYQIWEVRGDSLSESGL